MLYLPCKVINAERPKSIPKDPRNSICKHFLLVFLASMLFVVNNRMLTVIEKQRTDYFIDILVFVLKLVLYLSHLVISLKYY